MLAKLDSQVQNRLGLSHSEIVHLCQRWQITELALFGSILNNQFHDESDIDLLIQLAPEARQGLLTLAKMKHDWESQIGRSVDIALKESVMTSDNWMRRREILATAQVVYEQG